MSLRCARLGRCLTADGVEEADGIKPPLPQPEGKFLLLTRDSRGKFTAREGGC